MLSDLDSVFFLHGAERELSKLAELARNNSSQHFFIEALRKLSAKDITEITQTLTGERK